MKRLSRIGFLALAIMLCAAAVSAAVSVFPADGAQQVFNLTPIQVQFAAAVDNVNIALTPAVAGRVIVDEATASFVPSEAFAPQTEYAVAVTWDGGAIHTTFVTVNEIGVLYDEDFSAMRVGRFPEGWQIRSNEDATPNYEVVQFAESASGYALRAFDGGITWGNNGEGHALILGPGIEKLQHSQSKIVIESVIWIDKDAVWRSYLFPAGIVWPPYKDIGAKSATTPIAHAELQRHVVHHVYDPLNATIETYFDYDPVESGNPSYRDNTMRDYPLAGKVDFNIGIYTQGKVSSDVFWERIRVAELAR